MKLGLEARGGAGGRFMAASRPGSFVPRQRHGWRGLPGEVEPRVPLTGVGGWLYPGTKGGFVWGTETPFSSF